MNNNTTNHLDPTRCAICGTPCPDALCPVCEANMEAARGDYGDEEQRRMHALNKQFNSLRIIGVLLGILIVVCAWYYMTDNTPYSWPATQPEHNDFRN